MQQSFLTATRLFFVSPHCRYDDLFLLPLNPEGVYAWIGINFVLGRFDHADEGECDSLMLTCLKLTCCFGFYDASLFSDIFFYKHKIT